jgi:hypothetical protein
VTGVTTSTLRNDYSGWVGLRFTVGQYPLRVSELGRWVVSGNSSNHTVKIVTANGYDVPGASVTVVTAGAPAGEFKYATLAAPVTLAADTGRMHPEKRGNWNFFPGTGTPQIANIYE